MVKTRSQLWERQVPRCAVDDAQDPGDGLARVVEHEKARVADHLYEATALGQVASQGLFELIDQLDGVAVAVRLGYGGEPSEIDEGHSGLGWFVRRSGGESMDGHVTKAEGHWVP